MRLIDADKMVHYQTYDDEHEEFREYTSTIAEFLDTMTDEGCPEAADAVQVVRCKDCKHFIIHDENVGFCKTSKCLKRTNGYCDDGVQKSRHDNAE